MTHLSGEQIARWMAGERAGEAQQHMASCECCRGEVAAMEDVLAQFRGSARGLVTPPPVLRQRRSAWPRWAAALAAAAALLVLVPVYRVRQAREREAMERQDTLLLQQVDAEISRAVPGSMDPLVKMVSWNSGNEGQK